MIEGVMSLPSRTVVQLSMKKVMMKMMHCLHSRVHASASPYLVRQRCRGKTRPPMGTSAPRLVVRQGEGHIAQRAEGVAQHDRDHTGSFTQVRAAARRKTLLLLWWIDGGLWWKRGALAQQGCLGTRAATRV